MSLLNDQQQRVMLVLNRMVIMSQESKYYANLFAETLDIMLDQLQNEGVFKSEGQDDPRGDFRNDRWDMEFVEGIDG